VQVGTFHAVASRMLRKMLRNPMPMEGNGGEEEGLLVPSLLLQEDWRTALGLTDAFTIYDTTDTADMFKRILQKQFNMPPCAARPTLQCLVCCESDD
jgi:superfamily I DNA/RNA helicase